MSTETSAMPGHVRKQFEIRAKLDAIAPLSDDPDATVTATELARHFAVRAQERFIRCADPRVPCDVQQIPVMCAEFAAAMALYALAEFSTDLIAGEVDHVATQIRDALEDGGDIGSWLFDLLGEEKSNEVAKLAGQLADLAAETEKADA